MGFDEKVDKEYEIPSRDIAQLQGAEIMQYYHTCLQKGNFQVTFMKYLLFKISKN